MSQRPDSQPKNILRTWQYASIRCAMVAAAFCIVVTVMLLDNQNRAVQVNPRTSPKLTQLKASLAQQPRNEQLKVSLRSLDEQLRTDHLKNVEFSRAARKVLVVGLALFLIAAGAAVSLRGKTRFLVGEAVEDAHSTDRKNARIAVTAVGVVLLAASAFAVIRTPSEMFSGMENAMAQAPADTGAENVASEPAQASSAVPAAAPALGADGAPGPQPFMVPAPPPTGNLKPLPPLNPLLSGQIKPLPSPTPAPPKTAGPPGSVSGGPPGGTSGGPPGSSDAGGTPHPTPIPERPKIETVAFDPSDYTPSDKDWIANWPAFRGPDGTAVAAGKYPATWDAKSGKGIKWKAEIPLQGENSAVVWGDRVFVCGSDGKTREIDCYDTESGKLIWRHRFDNIILGSKTPDVLADTGYAPSTMVTDGKRVFAVFPNGDIVCCDYDGRRVWSRNLGTPDSVYGYASSLAMYKSLLIVQYDNGGSAEDGKSAIFALQAGTGQVVWYTARPVPASWSSPVIARDGDRAVLVTCAKPWVIGYDATTGAELWRASCLGGDVAPSAAVGDGTIFACNTDSVLAAIKLGGSGDVTKSHILWKATGNLPSVPSPAVRESQVFTISTEGVFTCYDGKSGKKLYDHSYNEQFQSSPVVVGNVVYLSDEKGVTHIISTQTLGKEVSRGTLDERIAATPAFANGHIYIRGEKHLFCIEGD